MKHPTTASWLRRLPVLLAAIVLAGAMMGVLSCHLAVSEDAVATQGTPPGNQVTQTAPEPSDLSGDLYPSVALTFTPAVTVYLPLVSRAGGTDKWALWTGPTQLRGANVYQRRVYLELDGPDFFGPGPVGPPYTQADFDALAAMGANYVNISHPGLFTEAPPYTLDEGIQTNLDDLLGMIAQAHMFAVISFRTGPGRAEFSVCCFGDGWFDEGYYNDSVWQDQAAQDAWVAMWRYTAGRYKDNPIVVGYDLMVEPNYNEVGSDATDPLDIWDPEEFHDQ